MVADAPVPATGERDHLAQGQRGRHANEGNWPDLYRLLAQRDRSTFATCGREWQSLHFFAACTSCSRKTWPSHGEVVIVAPTESAAKTANGQTLHSFFGFPASTRCKEQTQPEAKHLLATSRFAPIRRRLAVVGVLLLDEVSMVAADILDVMQDLLVHSRLHTAEPCTVYAFGDFLQLGPLFRNLAFTGRSWKLLCGASMLELTHVHRQGQPVFVWAIKDARFGRCTAALKALMQYCAVSDEQYRTLNCTVLHLMPQTQ